MIDYKKIAKTIAKKQEDNILKTMQKGQSPDLYWNLEAAIEDALKYVANRVEKATRMDIYRIIEEFDNKQEPSNN